MKTTRKDKPKHNKIKKRCKYYARVCIMTAMTMISACAGSKGGIKLTPLVDPLIRTTTSGAGDIKLLEHQLLPIDYLHKNPHIKGLLINHYMGTGKTYLGIGFAQSYPEHPIIILAPRFLESHWQNQLIEYGVNDLTRFTFISYDDAPEKMRFLDLSQYIVLADEAHNLIRYMRSANPITNARYTDVYTKIRNAHRILALTGTPIYGDESDLAFIINLVSGENLLPFNQEDFRLHYTKIIPSRQFFRGYVTESNLVISMLPFALSMFSASIIGPWLGALVGSTVGVFLPVVINKSLDTTTYKLREFDIEKLKPVMNKYVSYFKFDEQKFIDFPAQDFKLEEVPYNPYQYSLFLRLVEGDLPALQLQRLLKSEHIHHNDEYVRINSTTLHEQIYSVIGAGRDIGNFEFEEDNIIIEAPKFLRIYDQLIKYNEQTVIYSNYYETGTIAFKKFLLRNGYKEKFSIIDPSLTVAEVNNIVSSYNRGEIKLLLLHPEITEGISLKGTQYLHILEPILNSTVLEQVIGRTRRFQSHAHLPKDKQKVHVRMWECTSSGLNSALSNINRANWFKRYRELAYLSRWGIGLSQVDKNMDKKALNPDELATLKLRTIERNLGKMQKMLARESIENYYGKVDQ